MLLVFVREFSKQIYRTINLSFISSTAILKICIYALISGRPLNNLGTFNYLKTIFSCLLISPTAIRKICMHALISGFPLNNLETLNHLKFHFHA